MAISYPRSCPSCKRSYSSRVTFCQHKSKCQRFSEINRSLNCSTSSSSISTEESNAQKLAAANARVLILEKALAQRSVMSAEYIVDGTQHHVYLLKTRHSIELKDNVIKVGRTTDAIQRKGGYPKGSLYIMMVFCSDAPSLEQSIIHELKKHCVHRKDFGAEYFEGDLTMIVNIFIQEYQKQPIVRPVETSSIAAGMSDDLHNLSLDVDEESGES